MIEGDIQGCFNAFQHETLLTLFALRIADPWTIDLVSRMLKAGVTEQGRWTSSEEGTPQGGVISPLLANVYLHELDRYLVDQYGDQVGYQRYADDFVIVVPGKKARADSIKTIVAKFLCQELGLTLSEKKTRVTPVGVGFDFLGYHLWGQRHTDGMQSLIAVPQGAVVGPMGLVNKVERKLQEEKAKSRRRTEGIDAVNQQLQGWMAHYGWVPGATHACRRADHEIAARWQQWMDKLWPQNGTTTPFHRHPFRLEDLHVQYVRNIWRSSPTPAA